MIALLMHWNDPAGVNLAAEPISSPCHAACYYGDTSVGYMQGPRDIKDTSRRPRQLALILWCTAFGTS